MSTVVSEMGKNGRTCPLFSTDSAIRYSLESLEMETQYPLISENNISEPVDACICPLCSFFPDAMDFIQRGVYVHVYLFDLLHLHPPGDKNEDILHDMQNPVYG